MRRPERWLILAIFCLPVMAQPWSGILAPARAIDWSQAGAGTLPARLTICSTLSPGATSTQINNAIAACAPNQTVFLNAGTYNLNSAIVNTNHSNVTLRGAGSNQTFLVFSSAGGTIPALVYTVNSDTDYSGAPSNTANWTAGYSSGTTSITLSNVTNLQVGSLLILDQLDDASDTGDVYVSQDAAHAFDGGGSGIGRPGTGTCNSAANPGAACRAQMQQVTVTSISGTGPFTVGITPGLYAPNWRSGQSPGAWWSSGLPVTGVGYEDFSISGASVTNAQNAIFYFQNAAFSWIARVRSINSVATTASHKHVWFYQSSHMTFRDSYCYGSAGQQESYCADTSYGSSDNLIENVICQHVATCTIREGDAGSVFGHNFAIDNFYSSGGGTFQQGDAYIHGYGHKGLWEGNIGTEMELDNIHGTNVMHTAFRNVYSGFDTGTETGTKTGPLVAMQIYSFARYHNIVGNVLGSPGKTTTYKTLAQTTTDNSSTGGASVFTIGYSSPGGQNAGCCINDLSTATSTMIWGNYDAVNSAVRFNTGEDGHTAAVYPAITNASQSFPASFYLPAKPAWWGSMPYPAIGPDVTGGSGLGGHSYPNPAANCYLNVMGGHTDGSSGALTFNPASCYPSAPSPPPTGIQFFGNLTISGNATFTTKAVNVPGMSIAPSSLNFGSVPVGNISTLPLVITSTGNSQLVFTSIILTDSTNYSQTNNCTTVIPGATCTINVTFAPQSIGSLNTTLTIIANDSGSPHVVVLVGAGAAAGIDLPMPTFTPTALLLPQVFVDPMAPFSQTVQQTIYIGNSTCPTAPSRTNYKGQSKGATVCDYADSDGTGNQTVINDWCGGTFGGDQRWDVIWTHGSSFNTGSNPWVWCDKYNGTPTTKFIVFHSDTPNPRGRTVCSHGIQDILTPPLADGGQRNHGCAGLLGFPAVSVALPVTNAAYTSDSSYNDVANMVTLTSSATGTGTVIQMGAASTIGSTFSDCGANGTTVCPTDGVNHIVIQDAKGFPAASVSASIIPVSIKALEWVGIGAATVLSVHDLPAAPHDIGFDENYFTADADDDGFGNNSITDEVQFACKACWFNHNYIDGVKRDASEDHGINLSDAPGPVMVNHNWCEGASICFWGGGGSPPAVSGLLTTNIERRRNRITYNERWLPSPGGVQSFSKGITGGSCSGGNTLVLNIPNTGANVISNLVVYLKGVTGVGSITNQWYTATTITATAATLTTACTNGAVSASGNVFGFASGINVTSAAAMNGKAVKDPTDNNPVAKNRTENKEGQSTVEDGEICENSGADGQAGFCLLISVRACGGVSWCSGGQDFTIQDWVTTNTVIRHSNQAIQISARSGGSNNNNWAITNTTCDGTGNNAAITATNGGAKTLNNGLSSPQTTQTVFGTDIYVTGSTVLANGFYATAYPTNGNYANDAVVTAKGTGICTPAASDASGTVYGPASNNGAGVSKPGRRYVFQNNLIYDIGNHANWDGSGAVTLLQNGGGVNNWSLNMTVTQVSPVVIVNAAVQAINSCPVNQLCPKVVQASVGDYAYIQCLADPRFSSGPPSTKGASIISVAGDQLSFTYTPQNGSPALTLTDTTSCPIAPFDSNTDSGYYGSQSFPWPFYWNHNTAVGVNNFTITPGGGGFNKNATFTNSFQLLPGPLDVAPANVTSTSGGFRCNNSDKYSATDLTGVTFCNDRVTLTYGDYAMATRSIANNPNFLNGTICGTPPCSQDPAVNPATNSVPPNVATSGASVTCSGVPCDATHFLPDSVGIAGSIGTTTYPLNLTDFRNYALTTSSPYRAGGILQASDNRDMGVQMSVLLNAQNRTLYVCGLPCGAGPFRDGPQYGFLVWNASVDPSHVNYRVYRNGALTPTATVTNTFYTDYGLPSGVNTWIVKDFNGTIETSVSGLTTQVF